MYEVLLKKDATVISNDFNFSFFSVSGKVIMNNLNGDYIDVQRSIQCSPAWNAAEFSVEANSGLVSLLLGEPSGSMTMSSNIKFVNGQVVVVSCNLRQW